MGIRFYCPDCGRKLNIKSFLAGKRGICPHCDARMRIPTESQLPAGAPKHRPVSVGTSARAAATATDLLTAEAPDFEFEPSADDPLSEAPEAVWYVRPASGGEFGPARGEIMRQWLAEGRVTADSMVWRDGWSDWRLAGPIFPSLIPSAFPSASVPSAPPSPVPSIKVAEDAETASLPRAGSRVTGRRKSVAPLVILGLLMLVLLAVTVVVLQQ